MCPLQIRASLVVIVLVKFQLRTMIFLFSFIFFLKAVFLIEKWSSTFGHTVSFSRLIEYFVDHMHQLLVMKVVIS